jgi:hypothetical protein
MTNFDKLFNSITNTVKTIDLELKDTNKTGIFFAPELYTAFRIGQDITKNKQHIFGQDDIEWLREQSLGNGGISDIVFEASDRKIVIEVKIKSTGYSYEADFIKLLKLPSSYERYFLALMDSFEDEIDGRPGYVLSKMQENIQGHLEEVIPTGYSSYKKTVNCHIHLFRL